MLAKGCKCELAYKIEDSLDMGGVSVMVSLTALVEEREEVPNKQHEKALILALL